MKTSRVKTAGVADSTGYVNVGVGVGVSVGGGANQARGGDIFEGDAVGVAFYFYVGIASIGSYSLKANQSPSAQPIT